MCAGLGKFNRVAQEIHEDLTEPDRITHEIKWDVCADVMGKPDLLPSRRFHEQLERFRKHLREIKTDGFQFQFAGFNLREIQEYR